MNDYPYLSYRGMACRIFGFWAALTSVVLIAGCVTVEVDPLEDRGSPMIVTRSGDVAQLTWDSRIGNTYTVLYADGQYTSALWQPLPKATDIPGTGATIVLEDHIATGQTRYYRLIVLEGR